LCEPQDFFAGRHFLPPCLLRDCITDVLTAAGRMRSNSHDTGLAFFLPSAVQVAEGASFLEVPLTVTEGRDMRCFCVYKNSACRRPT
jgi:hypothetical protein